MHSDEEAVEQHIQEEYQQSRVKKDNLKRKTRTHLVMLKPRETDLMKPETAEMVLMSCRFKNPDS